MNTLAFTLMLTGFWCCYHTSERAEPRRRWRPEKWLAGHRTYGNLLGTGLFLISVVLCMFWFGPGAGSFAFLVMLMTVASLVILLAPLKCTGYFTVVLALVTAIIFEVLTH